MVRTNMKQQKAFHTTKPIEESNVVAREKYEIVRTKIGAYNFTFWTV